MLSVANKPSMLMLNAIRLRVVMLRVILLSVVMSNVMAPRMRLNSAPGKLQPYFIYYILYNLTFSILLFSRI
jgi:hypothetical protein